MVLAPLRDAAGLRRVRVATYQSVSGAGSRRCDDLRGEEPDDHDLRMDWEFDGVEFDEEVKLREETRKILELPDLPVSATCVRVPVVVGHAEAVWIETETPLAPADAERILARRVRAFASRRFPRHADAIGPDEVLVGRVRADQSAENGLALFLACDNLRKGAALNAIQIAELVARQTSRRGPSLHPRQRWPRSAARGRGRRRRLERLLDDAQHLLARALLHGLQPAEVEPRQLDPPGRAHGPEPEVGEEIAREDRSMHEKSLGRGRALPVAVRERLERADALVPGLADRGEEQRLLDPGLRVREQIRARDEHGVVRRGSGREVGRARKERAGPYCIEPSTRPSSSR